MNKIIKKKKILRQLQNNHFSKKNKKIYSTTNKKILKNKNHQFNTKKLYSSNTKNLFFKKKKYRFKKKKSFYNFKISANNKINFLQQKFIKPKKNFHKTLIIDSKLTVLQLSQKIGVKVNQLIKFMAKNKINLTKDQILKKDLSLLIAEEMGKKVILNKKKNLKNSTSFLKKNDTIKYGYRPPIVTIMGHVDHGKTSLLNSIRHIKNLNIEHGGITQSIGAYHITIRNKKITFLDTPGHKAFKKMRIRGAKLTDLIIIVIAVDDGIMPQTIEAIKHAQLVQVPIIIVFNKIDKEKNKKKILNIQNQLMNYNIISENLGGENIFLNISAKFNIGISELLDNILLQSEILDLKVRLSGRAKGIVIESFLDKKKGPFISVLLKKGILRKGDVILCGQEYGKIKLILNEFNHEIDLITPSIPVKILGLSGLPEVGTSLLEIQNEKIAKKLSLLKKNKFKLQKTFYNKEINLEEMFKNVNIFKKTNIINIFLKSDSKGSLEALCNVINNLSKKSSTVKLNLLSTGIGIFTETDVNLAVSCRAILIGFNVTYDVVAKRIIDSEKLIFKNYLVIYDVLKELKKLIHSKLKLKDSVLKKGIAVVKNIFKLPKFGLIAGAIVKEGKFKKSYKIQLFRNNKKIYSGEILSLKRFKNDVNSVSLGQEFGIIIKKYNEICVGDIIHSVVINNNKKK